MTNTRGHDRHRSSGPVGDAAMIRCGFTVRDGETETIVEALEAAIDFAAWCRPARSRASGDQP
jgi:hypothetical protein